jgi:putative oxidoreductase
MTTTIPQPLEPGTGPRSAPATDLMTRFAQWLAQHSITALRISLGLVIAGFGALKFIAGASPAEALVKQTTEALTFGVVSGTAAVVITALLETFLGLILLTGRGLRLGLVVMAGWLGAIMAPPWRRSTSSRTSSWQPHGQSSPRRCSGHG